MKIQICSDLHLEFAYNRNWLREYPLVPKGDILVIAGDTYYLERHYTDLDFINKVADEFQKVYLIPGNHEYYGGFDVATALEPTYQALKSNVFMVNNQVITLEGVQLIFSTMWSKIQQNVLAVLQGMMDFQRIKFKGEPFQVDHFNQLHDVAAQFLSAAVQAEGKRVVVTHHLPSIACNATEFQNSLLNEAFCVDKTRFIFEHAIDFWIYGHSHRNLEDFKIGTTQMVTNQFGYVGWNEHRTFDYEKIIEV